MRKFCQPGLWDVLKARFTLALRIGDFLRVTYVNECLNRLKYKTVLDCFCNSMEFTQSHRPEGVIPNSYYNCKPGSRMSPMII